MTRKTGQEGGEEKKKRVESVRREHGKKNSSERKRIRIKKKVGRPNNKR
jgi:hypothetical protein